MITLQIERVLADLEETIGLSVCIAEALQSGGVVLLEGSLGSGKTTMVQSICRHLGVTEPVTSPTFDLVHIYMAGLLDIYHVDGYRIQDPREWNIMDLPASDSAHTVVLAEWGSALKPLYQSRLEVHLTRAEYTETRFAILRGQGRKWVHTLQLWDEEANRGL